MSKKIVHFNAPDYCEYFRFFLVEELALWKNPITLHYGKCSVIGRLVRDDNGSLFVESCKVLSLSKEYQLDDGMVRLPISVNPAIYSKVSIPKNVYAELYGEAILLNKNNKCDEQELLPKNSSILMHEVRELQIQMEAKFGLPPRAPSGFGDSGMNSTVRMTLKGLVNKFTNQYEPALQLYSFQVIDQPHELITCNLDIRSFRQKFKHLDMVRRNKR